LIVSTTVMVDVAPPRLAETKNCEYGFTYTDMQACACVRAWEG
jgi:hypothetical protein